jgi:hypothetical protein
MDHIDEREIEVRLIDKEIQKAYIFMKALAKTDCEER